MNRGLSTNAVTVKKGPKSPTRLKFITTRQKRVINSPRSGCDKTNHYACTLRYTTGVLTTAVLIYALGAGITAGAGQFYRTSILGYD